MTYRFASHIYDRRTGLFAAFILGTAGGYWYVSKAIITDMTRLFYFSATLITFFLGYEQKRRQYYLVSFAASAMAVLTKEPIGFLLPGLIIAVFLFVRNDNCELLHLGFPIGIPIFLLIAGCWYLPMIKLHGDAFIDTFIGTHNVLRATVSEHPNDNVWYYYIYIFIVGMFPWSLIIFYMLKKYWRNLRSEKLSTAIIFLLVWAITLTVFYQLIATKYPTYTLPSFLPIAILAAHLLQDDFPRFQKFIMAWFIMLVLLTFTVAVPLTHKASGASMSNMIRQELGADSDILLLSYGRRYSASLVYYLKDKTVYSTAKQSDIDNLLPIPRQSSWRDKNVMPFLAIEKLPTDRTMLIVCDTNSYEELLRLLPAGTVDYLGNTAKDSLLKVYLNAVPKSH